MLYEKLYEYVIHDDADRYQQKITEKLHPSLQVGIVKHHIAHQEKAQWEANKKRNDKSHNVRADSNGPDMHDLFLENKIIADEKDDNVQQRIATATYHITKSLQRDKPAKWRIKEIDK